ncbi:MAG: M20/M25/M40 family metallo-hydrolase [Lachnospira sp.]
MISKEDVRETFSKLADIDSPSLKEREIADHIKAMFDDIGIELKEDDSGQITGSSAGNLYCYIKGNGQKPLLLAAHMDTVMPAHGKKAIFHPDGRITSDGTTVLGADDISGITAIFEAIKYIKKTGASHRDLEIMFTTGEELYCKGAKAFNYENIKSRSALVLDLSGRIGNAAYAAPTILSFSVTVNGKAAHAGFCPEAGINAVKAACEAVSLLKQGHIDEVTTANIGVISGGEGINIVPEKCVIKGEIRSLNHEKALNVADNYKKIFTEAAERNGAVSEWTQQTDIKAYEIPLSSGIVADYRKACEKLGIEAELTKTFGGSDNNVFAQNGIEGLVIATSMNQVHGCSEYASVPEIIKVAELLIQTILTTYD